MSYYRNHIVGAERWMRSQREQDSEENTLEKGCAGFSGSAILQYTPPEYFSPPSFGKSEPKLVPLAAPPILPCSQPPYSSHVIAPSACFREVFGSEYQFYGQDYVPVPILRAIPQSISVTEQANSSIDPRIECPQTSLHFSAPTTDADGIEELYALQSDVNEKFDALKQFYEEAAVEADADFAIELEAVTQEWLLRLKASENCHRIQLKRLWLVSAFAISVSILAIILCLLR